MQNQNITATTIALATAAATAPAKASTTIVHSPEFKQFVKECTETFSAPSKSKENMAATEKEITDAMLAFVELFRMGEETATVQMTNPETGEGLVDADGAPLMEEITRPVDLFALEVQRTMALRAVTTRNNTATATIAKQAADLEAAQNELAALKAKLEALGVQG